MKNIIYISIVMLILNVSASMGQEKGLYTTIGGGLGANYYRYTLDNGNRTSPQLGFGGNLGIQYFFNQHWGIASGLGISRYNSKGNYANSWDNDPQHYLFHGMYDDDFRYLFGEDYRDYSLRLVLKDWQESQKGYFLEIPLMLMYQTKWGDSKSWGMYAGLGGKVQLPAFGQTYSVKKGSELSVSGHYPKPDLILPDPVGPDVSWHGYGTNSEITYKGDMNIKTSFALSGKAGLIKTLTPRLDLTFGVYLDYGLNNIKNGNKTPEAYLINPENNTKTIHPAAYVGDHLQYNGYINSHPVDKVSLMAIGGEIGLRIKLGKNNEKKVSEERPMIQEIKPLKSSYTLWVLDSLTQKPLSTQVNIACQTCKDPDNQTVYSSDKDMTTIELYPGDKYNATITKTGFPAYSTQFTAVSGQKEIKLLIPLHPSITGTVKNNNNNLLPDVNIKVTDKSSRNYEAITNQAGYFIIPSVDAGTHYYVIASKAGYTSDTIQLDIPSDPDKLQPSYVALKLNSDGIKLKPLKKMMLSALVLFDLDKFDFRPDAKKEINAIVTMLKENPDIQVSVEGHTDSRGSAAYNQKLSLERANTVKDYMIEQGVTSNRIKASGYGFSRLLNRCKPGVKCSEEEHQENRRVEFIFTEK